MVSDKERRGGFVVFDAQRVKVGWVGEADYLDWCERAGSRAGGGVVVYKELRPGAFAGEVNALRFRLESW